MATTALKPQVKKLASPVAPAAPETDTAIAAATIATSAPVTQAALDTRVVIFSSSIPNFIFREGSRQFHFSNGIYKATGDEIPLLRHATDRAWWLSEITVE